MSRSRTLSIACTPDSDDAFYYFALETGRLRLPGWEFAFHREPMSTLNPAALANTHHITAISSVLYPQIADRYRILSVGSSVGRGYGPVLASKRWHRTEELRGRAVGVGGIPTTGWFLLRLLCPGAVPVEMPFDRIGEAVLSGELDAGVMIHEELLYYPQLGLHKVLDLGAEWCDLYGLPLPVGLNVARRDLGEETVNDVCDILRRSMRHGLDHQDEALAWVSQFGRGAAGRCTRQFVRMFANEDSLRLGADVRRALRLLFTQTAELGLGTFPSLDIVEGSAVQEVYPQAA
jgi:1,4-dihydroxy-6-naphthoate synthase